MQTSQVLEDRVAILEARVEELVPRNEYGLTEEQAWAMARVFHILRHSTCPLLSRDPDGCRGFAREWRPWGTEPVARQTTKPNAVPYAGGVDSLLAMQGR